MANPKLTKIQSLDELGLSPSVKRRSQKLTPQTRQNSESALPRNMTMPIARLSKEELVTRCEQYERRYKQSVKELKQREDQSVKLAAEIDELKKRLNEVELENHRLLSYIDIVQQILSESL